MTTVQPEQRLALIHRVIVPAEEDYPKEYAILVTGQRSIFIRQPKTRSSFVLRREMAYGTALTTDVTPKTLEDYETISLEALAADASNLAIAHSEVISLEMKKEKSKPQKYNFIVRLTMNMQKEEFQVYNFEMKYRNGSVRERILKFYMVPLGAYFKPKRQTQNRDTILREYANDALEIFRMVLPGKIKSPGGFLSQPCGL